MKKLSLKLDDLRVDSFATGGAPDRMGTVRAHGFPTEYTGQDDEITTEDTVATYPPPTNFCTIDHCLTLQCSFDSCTCEQPTERNCPTNAGMHTCNYYAC